MKRHFLTLKKSGAFILATVLVLTLCSCGGENVTQYKIKNDKIGTEVSFDLPGSEEDWEVVDDKFGSTSEDFSYYPQGDDLDATNSWCIQVTVTAGADVYKRVTVDGKDPLEENESVVESDSGMKWLKTTNDDYHIYYGTCLDEYLNGYHVAEIKILPNGNLEKGQEPDKELFEKIEKTIINSFKYNNKYKDKPDFSDAAYTGSHLVKWPFDIPFEKGAIKAEEYLHTSEQSVRFRYEDAENPGTVYCVDLVRDAVYKPENNDGKSYLDEYFSRNGKEGYEDMEIAGYPSAARFNYENFKDEIIIELADNKAKKYPLFEMSIFIESGDDTIKIDEKSKQKIIDMVTAIVKSAEFLE